MLQLVVFDFDGVISDTEPAHYEMIRRAVEPQGIRFGWDDYQEKYLGYEDVECIERLLLDHGREAPRDLVERLAGQKAQQFAHYIKDAFVILPGVAALLTLLKNHHIPCMICSGALKSEVELILGAAGLRHHFLTIVAADDVASSKPDPECYRLSVERAAAALGLESLPATDCVAIEDSMWGIKAAKGAGLKCLAVTNSYPPERLSEADHIVADLSDVSIHTLQDLAG